MFIRNKKVYIGDTHGVVNLLQLLLRVDRGYNDVTFIHVGDVGIGFTKKDEEFLEIIDEWLLQNNCNLIAIRGNHDNPKYWKENLLPNCKQIYLVPDYTVIQDHLFIGGAISIDRLYRVPNVSWWEEEGLIYKSVNYLEGVKVVVSHNVPSFLPPYGMNNLVKEFHYNELKKKGTDLISELVEERKKLDIVFYELKDLEYWVCGHMHFSNTQDFKGTTFYQLSINEMKMI